MTELEKKMGVKNALNYMCTCICECITCDFFNPDDTTEGEYSCAIRDKDGNIPYYPNWDMDSAMK